MFKLMKFRAAPLAKDLHLSPTLISKVAGIFQFLLAKRVLLSRQLLEIKIHMNMSLLTNLGLKVLIKI